MHGLINKALQTFVIETHGAGVWRDLCQASGVSQILGNDGFETMQHYDDSITVSLIDAAATHLRLPRETVLEDLGTFLVSHERLGAVRRLLRFGGATYTDFLFSLDDLQGRSHLAVPDLRLPSLRLVAHEDGQFDILCSATLPGFDHVLVGVLRALADDYGALVVLDRHVAVQEPAVDAIRVELHDPSYTAGKRFDLTAVAS